MKKESALRYVGFNVNDDREKDDFYPTPSAATQVLLDRQKFIGNVLEPANVLQCQTITCFKSCFKKIRI